MSSALTCKTARTTLLFLLLCGLAACVRHRLRLGLISDWRFAVLRELALEEPSVDLLFLGTSRTARGIMPLVVERRLDELGEPGVSALNLAIVGIARPIAYLVLKDWLREHEPPRVVFVETSLADCTEWPHQRVVDFLGPLEALRVIAVRPYTWSSQKQYGKRRNNPPRLDPVGILRAFEREQLNVELGLAALGSGPGSCARALWNLARSRSAGRGNAPYWRSSEVDDLREILPAEIATQVADRGWYLHQDPAGRDQVLATAERAAPEPHETPFDDPGRYRSVKLYTQLLVELCREHQIRLVFIHLPGFLESTSPAHLDYHRALAEVFEPELGPLQAVDTYADTGHLSPDGAAWYSRELAEWLFTHPR